MDKPILMLAIAATVVFVLYTMFASFFGDHHNTDSGGGDSGEGFSVLQFLSIQSALLAVMSYSWSWLFWTAGGTDKAIAALATVITGTAMVAFYVLGMRGLRKLNTHDQIDEFTPAVGMHATVYSTIPANNAGYGLVTILCPKRGDFQINATSVSKDPIVTGTKVVLAELNLPSSVIVRPA
ncbi:hypothetical protein IFT48_00555 [Pseudomonas fluorescens]|uniref:hypothetical protein n=1 Tax=Pseudomonas fluorescens TaxID=294 RepID=UPI001930C671|nr:hypothetical protein [Pseudomonas fluorescens]MBD8088481.1 hypothetical protein [Pseudomonas fluorescens]